MGTQLYSSAQARIDKYRAMTLAHATPFECLAKAGRQVQMPRNNSKTYIARRWLPYGGTNGASTTTTSPQNTFFGSTTAVDRTLTVVQAHQAQEGVTPNADSVTPVDISVTIQQYNCLYSYTDAVEIFYEDDIPAEQVKQAGERMALTNESVAYSALVGSTVQFYGGTGTSRATVNGPMTLPMLRKISAQLQQAHGRMVNTQLKADVEWGIESVAGGWDVYGHTDLESDIRDLADFRGVESYPSGANKREGELGVCERFRFILSPEFPSILDAGASVASTPGYKSNLGTSNDVYRFVVLARDAFSQISVRGDDNSMTPNHIKPSQTDKSDPGGQRGFVYLGWWKAAMVENDGWMACSTVLVANPAN